MQTASEGGVLLQVEREVQEGLLLCGDLKERISQSQPIRRGAERTDSQVRHWISLESLPSNVRFTNVSLAISGAILFSLERLKTDQRSKTGSIEEPRKRSMNGARNNNNSLG